jgi:hypothetical protein
MRNSACLSVEAPIMEKYWQGHWVLSENPYIPVYTVYSGKINGVWCTLYLYRARILKLLRSPRIDSKELIPSDCVRQPDSYSVPSPHRLFKNSSNSTVLPVQIFYLHTYVLWVLHVLVCLTTKIENWIANVIWNISFPGIFFCCCWVLLDIVLYIGSYKTSITQSLTEFELRKVQSLPFSLHGLVIIEKYKEFDNWLVPSLYLQ